MCRDGYRMYARLVAEAEQWVGPPSRGDLEQREQSGAYQLALDAYRIHRSGCAVCGAQWPPDYVAITLDG